MGTSSSRTKLKSRLAAFRLMAEPHLEAAEDLARTTAPSVTRLLVLFFLVGSSSYFVYRLAGEKSTLMFPVWWGAAVLGYTLTTLLAIPETWWTNVKEWQGRVGYLVALLVAATGWLSAGFASGEINAMFHVSATLVPYALTAYSFAIAVFFICAAGYFLVVLPLAIFYIVSAVLSLTISNKGKGVVRRFAVFATILLGGQFWFLIAFQPISSGYAGPVVARLALEFDFDGKTLCKNLPENRRYLFLTANRDYVLQIQPTADWSMTPGEMADAKRRGDELRWIDNQVVVKCAL